MILLKHSNADPGIGFKDVHHLMKYFKDNIFVDLQTASEGKFDGVVLMSKIFEQNLTFKQVFGSSTKSIKELAKKLYSQKIPEGRWKAGSMEIPLDIRIFLGSMKSMPQYNKILMIYKPSPDGDWLVPHRTTWKDFYAEYFSKESTVLSEEEKLYKL